MNDLTLGRGLQWRWIDLTLTRAWHSIPSLLCFSSLRVAGVVGEAGHLGGDGGREGSGTEAVVERA